MNTEQSEAPHIKRFKLMLRDYWNEYTQSSLFLALVIIFVLLCIGTLGYILIEGWTVLEALYATVITITTVGYGDYSPQTLAGRIFAIVFTLVAIGGAGYAISTLAAVVFEAEQTRKIRVMRKRRMTGISELSNHVIVCGANVAAHRATNDFLKRGVPFVIIEPDEEKLKWALLWMHESYVDKRIRNWNDLDMVDFSDEEDKSIAELADESGILYLLEDPKEEIYLRQAGIERALGIIVAQDDDLDNIAIILSAKDMGMRLGNPELRIVALLHNEWNMRRMYLAGAQRVVAPNTNAGMHLSNDVLYPVIAEFWNHMMYRDENVNRFVAAELNKEYPQWVGRTISDIMHKDETLIIAIKRDGEFISAPSPSITLQNDDVLMLVRSER